MFRFNSPQIQYVTRSPSPNLKTSSQKKHLLNYAVSLELTHDSADPFLLSGKLWRVKVQTLTGTFFNV